MSEPNQKPQGISFCPRTFWGALSVACICAAVVFIVYRLVPAKSEEPRRLWTPVVVETNGNQTILGETRQLEFWTPSVRTKDFLPAKNGSIYIKEKWEVVPSDDAAFQFGSLLHSNRSVLGYRRVEVWGHGTTEYKPGWWWSVTVTTNYTAGDLSRAYKTFWNPPSPVLVEVIDNRGGSN
jgi:hypothetical protein